ncbi:LysR family transcriptional regulator [Sphingobium sp. CECT 9361]|uniref:LysR family transcriptional regulator n=1 Tax=Sphingobium sp. CECT 9361 TaxID=2845384 RepID=UPI001E5A0BB5|nr:LysR family transcriptional regulator [Sphingobium sp. CECT 9361]CAH0354609.1 hypothetical protein SPH9361_03067 [Sphingobium sp. CECT 9361]
MITPTLRQLDIFAQMIASGSVADCARDLDLLPSDVEREIDALETRLGHRLFDRTGGIATLTEAGRKTVEAMQMLSETAPENWQDTRAPTPAPAPTPSAIIANVQSRDRSDAPVVETSARQTITVAAHPAIFSHFQDALTAFEQTNADVVISLDLDTHNAAQAIPRLIAGRIDIAYFYALGAPEGWPSRYAWSEQLSIYIGDAHPLSALESVMAEDLHGIAPIMLVPDNSLRPLIDEALSLAHIERIDPVLETDNLFDIMLAVREGRGYFAAFGPLARDFARMDGIRRLPLAFPLPAIDVRQAVRTAPQDDHIVSALSEYLFR